jgi:GGDEF domain-containing protein
VLDQELARLDRWGRPLSLALLTAPELGPAAWPALGRLLSGCLRRIDLAARLGLNEAAVILPDADEGRAWRWLLDFMGQTEKADRLRDIPFRYGLALARPWEGRLGDELVALAVADLGRDKKTEEGGRARAFPAAAVAADERGLLFDGFKTLFIA